MLPVVHDALRYVEHVIVVDDGSGERNRSMFERLPKQGVTVVRHRINLGKGAALKTGAQVAQLRGAEVIVFLDSDGQHRPKDIPRLVAPIEARGLDIVFGSRRINRTMPWMMRVGNHFFSIATNLLFRIWVSDTQSGFRAFRAAALAQLDWGSPRYAVETEMIVNAGKHRLRYAEVEIQTIYHDKYKGTTVFDGLRIFIDMLLWRLSP